MERSERVIDVKAPKEVKEKQPDPIKLEETEEADPEIEKYREAKEHMLK
jgi:hypothetical protein